CQVGVFMGYVSGQEHALLDFRLSLSEEWARDKQRREDCHVPSEVRYHTREEQCLEMLDAWGDQVPHGWVTGDDELGRHTRFRRELREPFCSRFFESGHDTHVCTLPHGSVAPA